MRWPAVLSADMRSMVMRLPANRVKCASTILPWLTSCVRSLSASRRTEIDQTPLMVTLAVLLHPVVGFQIAYRPVLPSVAPLNCPAPLSTPALPVSVRQ